MLFVYEFILVCTGYAGDFHTVDCFVMMSYMGRVFAITTYKRRQLHMGNPGLGKQYSTLLFKKGVHSDANAWAATHQSYTQQQYRCKQTKH